MSQPAMRALQELLPTCLNGDEHGNEQFCVQTGGLIFRRRCWLAGSHHGPLKQVVFDELVLIVDYQHPGYPSVKKKPELFCLYAGVQAQMSIYLVQLVQSTSEVTKNSKS